MLLGSGVFKHNGSNALLPRGQSTKIKINYSPCETTGTSSATLSITGDADQPQMNISLTGSADDGQTTEPDTSTEDTSSDTGGGGGGGCFVGAMGLETLYGPGVAALLMVLFAIAPSKKQ